MYHTSVNRYYHDIILIQILPRDRILAAIKQLPSRWMRTLTGTVVQVQCYRPPWIHLHELLRNLGVGAIWNLQISFMFAFFHTLHPVSIYIPVSCSISHSALPWKFGAGPVNTLSELHLAVTWRGGPVMCSADRDGCYGPPTDCKDKGTRRHANEDRKLVQTCTTCITALCNTVVIRRELNLRLRW